MPAVEPSVPPPAPRRAKPPPTPSGLARGPDLLRHSHHESHPHRRRPGDALIEYLNQTIDWYRLVSALNQTGITSEEVLFRDNARRLSGQVLRLGFTFARADVPLASGDKNSGDKNGGDGKGGGKGNASAPAGADKGRAANLSRATAAVAARVAELQTQIDRAGRRPPPRPARGGWRPLPRGTRSWRPN